MKKTTTAKLLLTAATLAYFAKVIKSDLNKKKNEGEGQSSNNEQ